MNPAKGMVRVPTWFWVDGYDGRILSDSATQQQVRKTCHLQTLRGSDGLAVLDASGRPQTRQSCTTETTTFDVDVRLWPSQFTWDFGDAHSQQVPCRSQGDCPGALGSAYVDAFHASSIQHPYVWSSLGVGGAADAYTIQLAIAFAADYRVSVNGSTQGGWQGLPERSLVWSAPHQVQEAQAVLTRPCPVTILHC